MTEPPNPNAAPGVPTPPADPVERGRTSGFDRPVDPLATTLDAPASPGVGATLTTTPFHADSPPAGLPAVPGYRVLREIARGGMGRILAAHDLTLDREIALKVLLPGADPGRFVRESKITARLPHPGIPPVHVLGTLADGSPFLAMKLIAGQTLAEELKTADRPRLLRAFTQVCQAVGFAHSRGVIHRDLKPANIMVGAFGEVQVMDWGLAKTVRSAECGVRSEDETAGSEESRSDSHSALRTPNSELTRAGTIMGTPAFMAPEQARGEETDARTDVFALGGILCVILTGQPPFRGRSVEEVIRRAGAAELAETLARLDGCGADAELIGLTKTCLAPEAADRPKDGRAVAEALVGHLEAVEQRLHQARLAEAEARARAAGEAKRRRLTLALAAAVLLAVLLGGGGAWLWYRNNRDARMAQVYREVNDALNQAAGWCERGKAALKDGPAMFARAREQAERTWTLAESGPVDAQLRARVRSLQGEIAAQEGKADEAIACYREAIALDPKLAPAHTGLGFALHGKGELDEAIASLRQAVALDRNLALAHTGLGFALHGKGQVDEAIACHEQAIALNPQLALAHAYLGFALAARAKVDEAIASYEQAIILDPKLDLAHTKRGLDDANKKVGIDRKVEEAVACYRQTVAIDPKDVKSHIRLAAMLRLKGEPDEAIACYRQAIALDPKNVNARVGLGAVLQGKGNFDEAVAVCREAVALDPKDVGALIGLGFALHDSGKLDEAVASLRRAVALDPKRAASHAYLGDALRSSGEQEEAVACFRRALALDPKDFHANYWLGAALAVTVNPNEALPYLQKAIDINKQRADELGKREVKIRERADRSAARADWSAAAAVYPQVFGRQPFGERGFECAAVLLLSGDQAGYRNVCARMLEASEARNFRPYHVARACTLAPDSVEDPALPGKRAEDELRKSPGAFWSLTEQGALAYRAGRFDQAAALFERSLQADIKPGRAVVNWLWLSLVEHRRGKPAEARAWLEKATKFLDQFPQGIPEKEDDWGLHLHNWLEAQVLRREAERSLGLGK
jgi:tetratricopeptide (TPR) repeat protein